MVSHEWLMFMLFILFPSPLKAEFSILEGRFNFKTWENPEWNGSFAHDLWLDMRYWRRVLRGNKSHQGGRKICSQSWAKHFLQQVIQGSCYYWMIIYLPNLEDLSLCLLAEKVWKHKVLCSWAIKRLYACLVWFSFKYRNFGIFVVCWFENI